MDQELHLEGLYGVSTSRGKTSFFFFLSLFSFLFLHREGKKQKREGKGIDGEKRDIAI